MAQSTEPLLNAESASSWEDKRQSLGNRALKLYNSSKIESESPVILSILIFKVKFDWYKMPAQINLFEANMEG